jgi:hypothetical protein
VARHGLTRFESSKAPCIIVDGGNSSRARKHTCIITKFIVGEMHINDELRPTTFAYRNRPLEWLRKCHHASKTHICARVKPRNNCVLFVFCFLPTMSLYFPR